MSDCIKKANIPGEIKFGKIARSTLERFYKIAGCVMELIAKGDIRFDCVVRDNEIFGSFDRGQTPDKTTLFEKFYYHLLLDCFAFQMPQAGAVEFF